jgi:hypothetical protein
LVLQLQLLLQLLLLLVLQLRVLLLSSRKDLLFSRPTQTLVISTEATHSLIVSGAVERPPYFAVAVAVACSLLSSRRDLLLQLSLLSPVPSRAKLLTALCEQRSRITESTRYVFSKSPLTQFSIHAHRTL